MEGRQARAVLAGTRNMLAASAPGHARTREIDRGRVRVNGGRRGDKRGKEVRTN